MILVKTQKILITLEIKMKSFLLKTKILETQRITKEVFKVEKLEIILLKRIHYKRKSFRLVSNLKRNDN